MEKRDDLYLRHIIKAIEKIGQFTKSVTFDDFAKNELLQSAVIHQFMIIGEAANKVSREYRDAHPLLPWREMISMRNKLIHDYFHVNMDDVWKSICSDLPDLLKTLQQEP